MSVDGVVRIPLERFEDERGWFVELRRDSALPRPTVQTNLSYSRKGVIRGLHYHERGQDDLFACLDGTARVVVGQALHRRVRVLRSMKRAEARPPMRLV